ncbi:MAG: ComF family protein [Lachnospira sp.]
MYSKEKRYSKEKIKKIIQDIIKNTEDVLYPPACPICGKPRVVKNKKRLDICPWCLDKITYVDEPTCIKCGKALDDDREYCQDCMKTEHIYDQAVSLYEYSDGIKQSIYRFKYHNKREYAAIYAREIERMCGMVIRAWRPDVIIPVPIHESKLKQRGYNQAELIADELSGSMGIPINNKYIMRIRKTTPMKELSNEERVKNLQNAFQICNNSIRYNKVLIVDDIYTTGATVDACARCFKESGTDKVYVVTLCIGKGF